jgi:poly(3-hydroxybutyrate) depolymerase
MHNLNSRILPLMKTAMVPVAAVMLMTVQVRAADKTFEYDAGPQTDSVLTIAQFRLYIPPGHAPLRGTAVLLVGRNGDGRGRVNEAEWRKFASETRFALMGCFLQGTPEDHSTYQLDKEGATARLIDKAIKELGNISKRPELDNLPRAPSGGSAGANVSVAYVTHFPERTVGVAVTIPTAGFRHAVPGKESVPIFAMIGKKDDARFVEAGLRSFEAGRGQNATWTLALHERRGHDSIGTTDMLLSFLRAAITDRLGAPAAKTQPKSASGLQSENTRNQILNRINIQNGWLGNLSTYEIAPYAQFKGDNNNATWLPDKATATAWQTYLKAP